MKPTKNKKPKARRTDKIWKKLAALPPRIWTIGGAAMLIIMIAWFMLAPDRRDEPPKPTSLGAAGTAVTANPQPSASAASPEATIPEKQLSFIQAIRLQPSRPTRMDNLKAEVEVAPTAPEKLLYTYLWKVNDQIIEEAKGDTLNLSPFKKRDLVTVTVTPHDGDTAGYAVESPIVAIHSGLPSLELKAMHQPRKAGEPIELQLVGVAPDGDPITFSLEPPQVPGMTIDKLSGKILWLHQPDQKGSIQFGAAVEDDTGSKITKTFTVTVD
jgi:hypothetical protein